MYLLRALIAVCVLALAGCPAGSSRSGNDDSTGEPSPGSDSSMTPFQKALTSFRTSVATKLGQPASTIKVIPGSEDVVGFDDLKTGELIAFSATAGVTQMRGMASPGGQVVMLWQGAIENLDVLLKASNLLEPAQSLPALELARRIVWLHGVDYTLIASPADWQASTQVPPQVKEPVIERAADGAATLRFFMNQAGDMGVILGFQADVQVQSGYRNATLSVQRAQN